MKPVDAPLLPPGVSPAQVTAWRDARAQPQADWLAEEVPVALVFNGIGSVWGSRPELKSQGPWLKRILPAAAVGGAVGAALLLFSQIFKEPLKGATRGYYRITGSWDDPQVKRVDAREVKDSRQAGSAAEAAAEPATGPGRTPAPP